MQALDSRADQLRHQLTSLPELAEIAALNQTRAELDNQARDLQIVVDDLSTDQRKADADVEQVKARRTRDRDRIDQGLITNPKDLERMQHELVSLDRRIATLEDEELEVMERLEETQQSLATVTEQIAAHDERLAALTASLEEKSATLRADLEGVIAERGTLVGDVPPDLLALYEKLRAAKGGSGAAALRARQCEGCRISIDAAELAVIKKAPSDEVVRCEECQRILVRTSESGL